MRLKIGPVNVGADSMTGMFRTVARRYALSMPILEVGFFTLLITLLTLVS